MAAVKIPLPAKVMLAAALTPGCAVLHHVQLGEIDNRTPGVRHPVDIKVSETGVNLDEATDIVRAVGGKRDAQRAEEANAIISLFQQGPRTGNPVYVLTYARRIPELLREQCPSGRLTNIVARRETRKYPVISGEIVRITGTCISTRRRSTAPAPSAQEAAVVSPTAHHLLGRTSVSPSFTKESL